MLRPYQEEAVAAVYRHLRQEDDNPCVVIPTAGGKSHVMARICADAVQRWRGRVIVLAHVRELLEQTADKLHSAHPDLPVGVYSAGLGSRDLGYAITIAGIQSVYQKAELLGAADLLLVDEAHLIPPDGEGMYRSFIASAQQINPQVRVIGFTATPFRMSTGPICTEDGILNQICYEIGVKELIQQGYLCKLTSKGGTKKPNLNAVHVRGGEFVPNELEAAMQSGDLVESACTDIWKRTQDRKSVLVFATGIQHALHIQSALTRFGVECGFVCGETPSLEREMILSDFRAGRLKYLVNVGVLTTGFDAPIIDCVALLRPTMSPGLYYQMVGRGFRLSPGKEDCLVLDFGGNVLRHGPVDAIRADPYTGKRGDGPPPAKECPACFELVHSGYSVCPKCGEVFEKNHSGPKHDGQAGDDSILSETRRERLPVRRVTYSVHHKKDAPPGHPRTLRVDYQTGNLRTISEWVCVEHDGFAFAKALTWWRRRTNTPIPDTVEEAVELADAGHLAVPQAITIETTTGEKFPRITDCELGPIPDVPYPAPAPEPEDLPATDQYGLKEPLLRPDGLPEEVPF